MKHTPSLLLAAVIGLCAACITFALSVPEPLRIVPTGGQDADNFGAAIAMDQNLAAIGAPLHDGAGTNAGAAYLFTRDIESGTWTETAIVTGNDVEEFSFFAIAIALKNDLLVAGSPQSPTFAGGKADSYAGAAYLFQRDTNIAEEWHQVARLSAEDGGFGDEFGRAVAVAGRFVAVGARSHESGGIASGAVYLFERADKVGTWVQAQQLTPLQPANSEFFGAAVAMHGDILVVGAPGEYFSPTNPGAVYVFQRMPPPFSAWNQLAKLVGSDVRPGSRFGMSVAFDGNVIAASSNDNDGVVYLFERVRDGHGWAQIARLVPDPPEAAGGFGFSIAIDGRQVIVGSPFYGNDGAGAACVFSRGGIEGNTWSQISRVAVADTAGARVGYAVATSQGSMLLGAPLSTAENAVTGAVFAMDVPSDMDGDGIADFEDNCIETGNGPAIRDAGGSSQRDTDGDNIGNSCDADLNGDCSVNFSDLAQLHAAFFTVGDVNEDFDGDGQVNFADLATMKSQFFAPPGPSGLQNACE